MFYLSRSSHSVFASRSISNLALYCFTSEMSSAAQNQQFSSSSLSETDAIREQNETRDGPRIPRKLWPDKEFFLESHLVCKEPFGQFKDWFDNACQNPEIHEPNAMALATSTRDGRPSVRMVLLKGFGPSGFNFFTNYDSRKGKELEENPRASLMFYWDVIKRQVRIEGAVGKLSEEESTEYFFERPIGSQIAASVSDQSRPVPSREYLMEQARHLAHKCQTSEHILSRPSCWGGYLLMPEMVEFWQGQPDRLHDRIRFRKPFPAEVIDPEITHIGKDGWVFERLAP